MATAIMQGEVLNGTEQDEQLQETHQRNVAALTGRVGMIKAAKVDAVASTRALRAVAIASGDNHPAQVLIQAPGELSMQIGPVAHDQFANVLKIDKRYYDRMKAEAAPLLAQNINWWFENTPAERLLRMLRPAAFSELEQAEMASVGAQLRLRGVLGKGYRTIDDSDLVESILPQLIERGATLQEFSIDERRLHAAFYTRYQDVNTIRSNYAAKQGKSVEEIEAAHGWPMGVNEVVAAGVVIRHSEVGFASLGASFVMKVLKCLNRMVADSEVSIRHVGGKNGSAEEDVRYLSEATSALENAALLGRVQDSVTAALSDDKMLRNFTRLLSAKVEPVARPAAQPLFEFVGNMGANLGLSQGETELLKQETASSVAEERGEVRFAFVQGITAVARQMTDYDRRLELERTGFQLLQDESSALLKLGRDAEKRAKRSN